MKTIKIDLSQFSDINNPFIKGLISLSSDFFNKKKVFHNCLWLETSEDGEYHDQLYRLCEASSVDFKFKVVNASISKIEEVLA